MQIVKVIFVAAMSVLAACSSQLQYTELEASRPDWLADAFTISDMPFFAQDEFQCGPAALAMMLGANGISTTPADTKPLVYVPDRQGSFQPEMIAAARSFGLLAYELEPSLSDLIYEIASGHPVLVLQNLGLSLAPQWHFAVAKGFDLENDRLILNSGEIEDYSLSIRTFERTWQRADYWSVVIVEPGVLPTTANPNDYFVALAGLQRNSPTNPDLDAGFVRGLEEWPEDRNLLMGYGNFLADTDELYGATDVFSETINLYPQYGPAHNNMAEVLMRLGRLDEALYHVQAAITLEDDFNAIYVNTLRQLETLQQQVPN